MGCFNKTQMKIKLVILFSFTLVLIMIFQDQIYKTSDDVIAYHHKNNRKGNKARVHHGFSQDLIRNDSLLFTQDAIPHIIHQSWKNSLIHLIFQPWILSWRRNHPSWKYWFWTDIDLLTLVQKKFPQYQTLFNSYQTQIEKVDVAKYMILYEYGGVFADLDMVSLKSIDRVLQGHALVLAKEPWIHSNLFDKMEMIVSNAIMASRPKHPFMKWILEHLQDNVNNPTFSIVWRTGPHMLTKELARYNQAFKESLERDKVTLLEHDVLLPRPEPIREQRAEFVCKEWNNLLEIQKNACRKLNNGTYRFVIDPIRSFTDHKWLGTTDIKYRLHREILQLRSYWGMPTAAFKILS